MVGEGQREGSQRKGRECWRLLREDLEVCRAPLQPPEPSESSNHDLRVVVLQAAPDALQDRPLTAHRLRRAADLGDQGTGRQGCHRRRHPQQLGHQLCEIFLLSLRVQPLCQQLREQGPGLRKGHPRSNSCCLGRRCGDLNPQRTALVLYQDHLLGGQPATALQPEEREPCHEIPEHAFRVSRTEPLGSVEGGQRVSLTGPERTISSVSPLHPPAGHPARSRSLATETRPWQPARPRTRQRALRGTGPPPPPPSPGHTAGTGWSPPPRSGQTAPLPLRAPAPPAPLQNEPPTQHSLALRSAQSAGSLPCTRGRSRPRWRPGAPAAAQASARTGRGSLEHPPTAPRKQGVPNEHRVAVFKVVGDVPARVPWHVMDASRRLSDLDRVAGAHLDGDAGDPAAVRTRTDDGRSVPRSQGEVRAHMVRVVVGVEHDGQGPRSSRAASTGSRSAGSTTAVVPVVGSWASHT